MTTELAIPDHTSELTAEWVTQMLRHSGHDVAVASCAVSPIGTGQMANSYRVRLDYASNNSDAPDSIVVKIASDNEASRAAGASGSYLREVRYYQELDATVNVDTPRFYWASIDTETHAFALVLEDMAPAVQGDQIAGCSVEHALAATRNIAGLHAPRWGDASLFELAWLGPPQDQRAENAAAAQGAMELLTPGFLDRYQARVTATERDTLSWFAPRTAEWLSTGDSSFSLGHADHRLDNLLFADRAQRPVTVVDWQTVGVRNPLCDVAYLLGTGLEPEVRRSVEHDIVAEYHQELTGLGVRNYDFEQCFEDYRTQSLHALLITVLGSMMTGPTKRGDDMFMAMLSRSCQQIADLEARW